MTKKWQFLTGDANFKMYGGKWYNKINDDVYHVISLINLWDAMGDEGGLNQYNVELQEIDFNILSEKNIISAMECCGMSNSNNETDKVNRLMLVESISDYGCYIPMGNWSGNNYKNLLARARDESRCLMGEEYHEKQLQRPVNQIGSTALEYGQGDTISAMIRGIANDDPGAKIIGKMHGLKEADINEIKNDVANKQFGLWDN